MDTSHASPSRRCNADSREPPRWPCSGRVNAASRPWPANGWAMRPIYLDEIHWLPAGFSAVRSEIDRDRRPGRFTGLLAFWINGSMKTNTHRRNPCQASSEASTTIPASSNATRSMLQPPSSNRPTDTGATAVEKIIADCAKARIAPRWVLP